jgi:hypothetical protein
MQTINNVPSLQSLFDTDIPLEIRIINNVSNTQMQRIHQKMEYATASDCSAEMGLILFGQGHSLSDTSKNIRESLYFLYYI